MLLWDGLGLSEPYSGIYRIGERLLPLLKAKGLHPFILSDGLADSFWPIDHRLPIARSFFSKKFKIFRPFGRFLPQAALDAGPIILHGMANFNLPFLSQKEKDALKIKLVLTVHDVIPLLVKTSFNQKLLFSFYLPKALASADRIICVSSWTREELAKRFSFCREKLVLIPNGFDNKSKLLSQKEAFFSKSFLKTLTVSRFETYKNLPLLLELLKKEPKLYVQLVTDKKGVDYFKSFGRFWLDEGRLEILTALKDSLLADLYGQADVYLQPSFYEGFCLPGAEALCSGTPVAFMKGSAMDEVYSSYCAKGLLPKASALEWLDVLWDLKAQKECYHREVFSASPPFFPSWERAADSYEFLYNSLR